MKNWRDIATSLAEALVAPENPIEGAGEVVDAHTAPSVVYHGTNPIAAAAILRSGKFEATHAVDSDGPVVCVTACPDMGQCFAIEFVRLNSEHDVGFVFALDGKAIADKLTMYPYHAETAGAYEFEYRVEGDIPLSAITGVRMVGDTRLITADDGATEMFFEELWEETPYHLRHHFEGMPDLWRAVLDVVKMTR